ncbi:hypothetical protein ACFE04_027111 [Oxalis oulophora]
MLSHFRSYQIIDAISYCGEDGSTSLMRDPKKKKKGNTLKAEGGVKPVESNFSYQIKPSPIVNHFNHDNQSLTHSTIKKFIVKTESTDSSNHSSSLNPPPLQFPPHQELFLIALTDSSSSSSTAGGVSLERCYASLAHAAHTLPVVTCPEFGPVMKKDYGAFGAVTLTSVTGLNNNEYQIGRGKAEQVIKEQNMLDVYACYFHVLTERADFMKMPFSDNKFDAVYAIEATCHAPDAHGCYKEIYRVLKPGQSFAAYEWCMTEAYDPQNKEHQHIKNYSNNGVSYCSRETSRTRESKKEILKFYSPGPIQHRLEGRNAWYAQMLAKGEINRDMGDNISGKGMIQTVEALSSVPAPELALRLYLQCAEAANDSDLEPVAYEFFTQAYILYEEEISDSKAQIMALHLIIGMLQRMHVFGVENRDTLTHKATGYSAKLLKKPDQCRAVYACSQLFWVDDQDDVKDGERDVICRKAAS